MESISDHSIIHVETSFCSRQSKKIKKPIFAYSRTDIISLLSAMDEFEREFAASYTERSTSENRLIIKKTLGEMLSTFVPRFTVATEDLSPWFTNNLRHELNEKKRLFSKAKRTDNSVDWTSYKTF